MELTETPAPPREPHAARWRAAVAPLAGVHVRDATGTGDGSWTVEGYAAVYEQQTTLYDTSFLRVREVITRGAFTNVLASQPLVHLNFGHDMTTAIAGTDVQGIGGLELAEDFHGLRFFARVDPSDPDAIRVAAKMRAGIVRQASFAFTIDDEDTVEDDTDPDVVDVLYRINRIRQLFDVCVTAQGAYPQTESHIRALAGATWNRVPDPGAGSPHRAPVGVGARTIAPPVGGPEQHRFDPEAAQRHRRRALALHITNRKEHA